MKYILRSINTEQVFCLDVTTDYSESHKANITNHPVEQGSPISDHIYVENPTISLTGMVSDYDAGSQNMIDLSSYESSMFQDIVDLFQDVSDIVTGVDDILGSEPASLRTVEFAKALKLCFYQSHIFSLIIKDEKTDNIVDHFNTVAIEGLEFKRSINGGAGAIDVDLKLKQVRTAKIKRTEISNAEKDAIDKSTDKQLKVNATKDAKSGKTGATKSGSKTSATGGSLSTASSAFESGASEGASAGTDYAGKATAAARALGSSMTVSRKDLEKQANAAQSKVFGH
jgi:hypothetical protein